MQSNVSTLCVGHPMSTQRRIRVTKETVDKVILRIAVGRV